MRKNSLISKTVQRRFILGKQGLWPGRRWTGKTGIAQAIRSIEAVQVDPVAVIAPSHDIVMWGRVNDYRQMDLNQLLYTDRKFFDYGGGLMIYPIEELPYWRVIMAQNKQTKRWATFAQSNGALLDDVRREIRDRGPLRSRDMKGRAVEHYRSSKDTGVALYYLWLTGELMIHSRHGKERVYDFFENIAPANLQNMATQEEAIRFFTRKAISHLGFVTERDFRRILKSVNNRPVDAKETAATLAKMLEAETLNYVHLETTNEPLYFLASDTPLLESLSQGVLPLQWMPEKTTTQEAVTFLSPLEYVSARGRAKKLFDFDYIWEIYKPAEKRKYGPYTLPVLYGDQLVARIDIKFEKQSQTLIINGFWLETWFAENDEFASAFANGLFDFAKFLDAKYLDTTALSSQLLRTEVDKHMRLNGVTPI